MTDCIFCKIVAGDIPSSKILETENTLAFLDISPVNKGHVLVIPKEHYETLTDIPDDLLSLVVKDMKKVAVAVMMATKADGYNIQMNNYASAGQVVMHAHFHIVPRFKGDGFELWPGREYECGEAESVMDDIKSEVK